MRSGCRDLDIPHIGKLNDPDCLKTLLDKISENLFNNRGGYK